MVSCPFFRVEFGFSFGSAQLHTSYMFARHYLDEPGAHTVDVGIGVRLGGE
jgi:hypothetical protein